MISKIESLSEISNLYSDPESVCNSVNTILKRINLSSALVSGKAHQRSKRSVSIMYILIVMRLLAGNSSIHKWWQNNFYNFIQSGKNGFYRFMNRPLTDWRLMLSSISQKYRETIDQYGTTRPKTEACFIVDDTTIEKTGKRIEGISRVHDHISDDYVLGYKMLVLAFNDGVATQACDFSLHRESKQSNYGLKKKELKNYRQIQHSQCNPDSARVSELNTTKLDSILMMLKRAIRNKFQAKYLLADSWFSHPEFIKNMREVTKNRVHYLGIGRKSDSRYKVKGVGWKIEHLINRYSRISNRKNAEYNCNYFSVKATIHDCPVKLLFARQVGCEKWNFIITTDMDISFVKAYELYQVRWTIEVLFKECKQYFKLGKCQSEHFNAQIADCTIALITHTLISLENRFSNYETLGGLFEDIKDQITMMTLWERIIKMILKIVKAIAALIGESMFELVRRLIIMNHGALKRLFINLKELSNNFENTYCIN